MIHLKKKIIFDASILVSGNVSGNIHRTGLYRVSYEVLKELEKSNRFELYLFDIFHRERELIKYVQKEFHFCNRIKVHSYWYRILIFPLGNLSDLLRKSQVSNKTKIVSVIAGLLKNSLLMIEKAARKIDRMFFIKKNLTNAFNECNLYYSTYFPIPEQVRLNHQIEKVYTVHDMIPIIHPEYFSSSFNQSLVKEVIDNIDSNAYVICVSESTKKDLLQYRPDLNPDRAIVAHLAASEYFRKVSDQGKISVIKEKFNIPLYKKYLLSVCTLEPRKNLKTIIASYRNILQEGKINDLLLVLTGSPGWQSDILMEEINELNEKYNNSIILTGFVKDDELACIYSGAYAFLYLSLYEGFGLPPLEAMKCGIPVISSKTSSLPEVLGDCGILIDPGNTDELTNAIILLYKNKNLHRKMVQKSIQRAINFSWPKTLTTIINIFDLAMAER